jgi:hypothetical protein
VWYQGDKGYKKSAERWWRSRVLGLKKAEDAVPKDREFDELDNKDWDN